MAFESTLISTVEVVDLTSRDADDGTLEDKTACFTNGDTETNCEELNPGTEGLRVQFEIPKTAWTALTMRFWDDGAMDGGDWACIPYTDANSVDVNDEIVEALVVNANTDFVLDAAFKADLGDADGAGNFAVRFAIADASIAKPKASEVQYEITFNTAPLSGSTFDDSGDVLGSKIVQAYKVESTNPLVLAPTPFDSDTSNAVTGEYSLDLYMADWVLIFFDDATPDIMDISEIISHTV